jgi:hypothetical protein
MALVIGLHWAQALAQSTLPVRVDRWLELQRIAGSVTFKRGQSNQTATVGTRLESTGDTLVTGADSSASLAVDTGIGTVQVSENTTLRVQRLESLPSGGRVTRLEILSGQARLQVRAFTDPDSELEIETPAGVSGVRGTDFGVSVRPDGTTGVATLEGKVLASAQGQSVLVDAGLQSLIVPGEPPTPAVPLREDTRLDVTFIGFVGASQVQIRGQVDPVNLLLIGDQPQAVDRNGQFNFQGSVTDDRPIPAVVITPLGSRQAYEIVIP